MSNGEMVGSFFNCEQGALLGEVVCNFYSTVRGELEDSFFSTVRAGVVGSFCSTVRGEVVGSFFNWGVVVWRVFSLGFFCLNINSFGKW